MSKSNKKIIAISGGINSGKDTAADMFQYCLNVPKALRQYWLFKALKPLKIFNKWKRTSFALPLKEILSIIFGIPVETFNDRKSKENTYVRPITASIKRCCSGTLNDNQFRKAIADNNQLSIVNSSLTLRQLMQWYGTTIMPQYFGENVWVNATLKKEGNLLITDVRFSKEAKAIKNLGGKIILIERPSIINHSKHISEIEWRTMKKDGVYDYIIENVGSLEDLFKQVKNVCDSLTTYIK